MGCSHSVSQFVSLPVPAFLCVINAHLLQIRRAGLMAALSSKTQQDNLIVIDTFTLSHKEAQQCAYHKILGMAGRMKELDKYFVPQRYQRDRLYAATDGDERILQDDQGNMLDDAAVADNVLKRTLENKEPLIPLFMNTSAPPISLR